jgi:hypothetical protein
MTANLATRRTASLGPSPGLGSRPASIIWGEDETRRREGVGRDEEVKKTNVNWKFFVDYKYKLFTTHAS